MTTGSNIRILLLEDVAEDAELVYRELKKHLSNLSFIHVDNRSDYVTQLEDFSPDIILSDFSMPGFNGLEALNIMLELENSLPFIIVTGSINEETAVDCIKQGATDYVTKENLTRLVPATINAIENHKNKFEALKAQKRALESEKKFLHAFKYANVGMAIIDLAGTFMQTNAKLSKILGYSSEELLQKTTLEISCAEDKLRTENFYKEFIEFNKENAVFEKRFVHKNGSLVWVQNSISLVKTNSVETDFLILHCQDITQRKKDEESIHKLYQSVEQSPAMVLITDLKGIIDYVNPKFEQVTGWKLSELAEKTPNILKSGQQDPVFYADLWGTLRKGEIWKGELLNQKKNGEKYWESSVISTVYDSSNKPTHYLAIKEDISERKEMETNLIRAKERAEESDRLKSAFLANVSHEIRTPMNSILGFSEIVYSEDLKKNQQNEYLQIIQSSGEQLLSIVNDILDISKLESGQLQAIEETFNLNNLLLESKMIFDKLINKQEKSIDFVLNIPDHTDLKIYTDKLRLTQIIYNLLSNAVKFTEAGQIKLGYKLDNGQLVIFVSDTGIGINSDHLDSIFDRFVQVELEGKRKHGGTGLGLSICKGLAHLLGGILSVKSEPDIGSEFSITFKLSKIIR